MPNNATAEPEPVEVSVAYPEFESLEAERAYFRRLEDLDDPVKNYLRSNRRKRRAKTAGKDEAGEPRTADKASVETADGPDESADPRQSSGSRGREDGD